MGGNCSTQVLLFWYFNYCTLKSHVAHCTVIMYVCLCICGLQNAHRRVKKAAAEPGEFKYAELES